RGNADQDLVGRDPGLAVRGRDERLRDDSLERLAQHRPDLGLTVPGEDVDEPVDRLRGGVGVERSEYQVARLGRRDGERRGLEVSPLPVGPVTSTSPRSFMASSRNTDGQPRSSSVLILEEMTRKTAPGPRRCMKTLARKRATSGTSNPKSTS